MRTTTMIGGVAYEEVDVSELPFTNMCNHCAFKGTACYTRKDFTCHADERPDGRAVVFVAQTAKEKAAS